MPVEAVGVTNYSSGNKIPFKGSKQSPAVLVGAAEGGGVYAKAAQVAKPMSAMKKFAYKALMGLGVIGAGYGVSSCNTINPPDVPAANTLTEAQKGVNDLATSMMGASIPSGKMLDSTLVKDESTGAYIGWKVLDSKYGPNQDTVLVRVTGLASPNEPIVSYKAKFYKSSNGNDASKVYDNAGQLLSTYEYQKDTGVANSLIESVGGVKKYKYIPQDGDIAKIAISNGLKGIIKPLFSAVK